MKRYLRGRVSLERAISKLGLASRKVAKGWILAGRISVNGTIQKDPNFSVVPEKIILKLDGRPLNRKSDQTILLYKPKGVITTRVDERGRKTVFSLIENVNGHMHAVGRLDRETSGLLLLTNDTRLSAWLTDPKNAVPRVYEVNVRGFVTQDEIQKLESGIKDKNEFLQAKRIILKKAVAQESHLTVELLEGKNREIRRMLHALDHKVTHLKRIAFGGLTLGDLRPGESRELSADELKNAFPGAPIFNKR